MGVQRTDVKLEVLAAFPPRPLPSRHDPPAHGTAQLIDPTMTRSLHTDACRDQLPPGLVRSERMPGDPPDVVEIWFLRFEEPKKSKHWRDRHPAQNCDTLVVLRGRTVIRRV